MYIIVATHPSAPTYYRSTRGTWVGPFSGYEAAVFSSTEGAAKEVERLQKDLPTRTVKAILP